MTKQGQQRPRFAIRSGIRAACRAGVSVAMCVWLGAMSGPARSQDAPTRFPVIPLSAGIHLIHAEVAATPAERERGLMDRQEMGGNQGMVFLFDEPAMQCMWMKNTLIPLSVAFIGDDGRILNIEDMAPQTEDNHCAAKPARYALEMNRGWFAKHGISRGSKISGLPPVGR